jgi:hypothetical protein
MTVAELTPEFLALPNLERVLTWLSLRGLPLDGLEMVTQDEYCHDLLIPVPGAPEWFVFGMT